MSSREKGVLGILGVGLVIMVSAGVLAFHESGRLLLSRRLAEEEFRDLELLDRLSVNLRDMRREGLNYVVLGRLDYRDDFRHLAGAFAEIREEVSV